MTEFTARREFQHGAEQTHVDQLVRELRDDLAAQAAAAGEELADSFEVSMSTPDLTRRHQVIEATGRGHAVKFPHPTVLVDFDGVLHRYSKGWQDGTVYDGPMDGAEDALAAMTADGYTVVIFSTRPADQIVEALAGWNWPRYPVTNRKVPAVAMIDDRAIRFEDWDDALHELRINEPVTRRG